VVAISYYSPNGKRGDAPSGTLPIQRDQDKPLKYQILSLLLWTSCAAFASDVQRYQDPATGLITWKVQEPGLSLQFIQLMPDYVTAVYSARGLPASLVKTMASHCVFGTIIKNESGEQLSYRVADWRYVTEDGEDHPIKTKSEWLKEWKEQGVSFRWSILPDDQTFEPGDWSQGFTTIPLPPDSSLNLIYTWRYQGENHKGTLEGLRCAPAQAPQR
jgi:hypothetical protein